MHESSLILANLANLTNLATRRISSTSFLNWSLSSGVHSIFGIKPLAGPKLGTFDPFQGLAAGLWLGF